MCPRTQIYNKNISLLHQNPSCTRRRLVLVSGHPMPSASRACPPTTLQATSHFFQPVKQILLLKRQSRRQSTTASNVGSQRSSHRGAAAPGAHARLRHQLQELLSVSRQRRRPVSIRGDSPPPTPPTWPPRWALAPPTAPPTATIVAGTEISLLCFLWARASAFLSFFATRRSSDFVARLHGLAESIRILVRQFFRGTRRFLGLCLVMAVL